MSIFQYDQVVVYYSIARHKYAGWKSQVSLITLTLALPHVNYYKDDFGFLKLILHTVFRFDISKTLVILPNLYGRNKILWWILTAFKVSVLPRVSGGELRIFKIHRWLAFPFQSAPIWVLNRTEYNLATELGLKPYIINNLVKLVDNKRDRSPYSLNGKEFSILMCGSISERKGQIQILLWLEDLDFKGEIYLVGPTANIEKEKGNYIEKLKKTIPTLSYKVELVGEVLDVDSYYRKCDLMILNSAFEGLPNVVLEALSHQLPTLGTRVQGTEDILSNLNKNLLYELGNFASFSRSFRWIQDSKNYKKVVYSCDTVVLNNYSSNVVRDQLNQVCFQSC